MEEKKLVIDSQYVGEPWPVVKRRVTWHQTTDYAAVIGDMNPLYVDDERDCSSHVCSYMWLVCPSRLQQVFHQASPGRDSEQ